MLDSNAWRCRRKRALRIGNCCAMCGATTSLQVHHLTYKHLGHELDNELVVLLHVIVRFIVNNQGKNINHTIECINN